jgi:hypothetical protein
MLVKRGCAELAGASFVCTDGTFSFVDNFFWECFGRSLPWVGLLKVKGGVRYFEGQCAGLARPWAYKGAHMVGSGIFTSFDASLQAAFVPLRRCIHISQ